MGWGRTSLASQLFDEARPTKLLREVPILRAKDLDCCLSGVDLVMAIDEVLTNT
jgi:hypothetical protein